MNKNIRSPEYDQYSTPDKFQGGKLSPGHAINYSSTPTAVHCVQSSRHSSTPSRSSLTPGTSSSSKKTGSRTKSVSPAVQNRNILDKSKLSAAKSMNDIQGNGTMCEEDDEEAVEAAGNSTRRSRQEQPKTEPPKRRNAGGSCRRSQSSVNSLSRRSTAASTHSLSSNQQLSLQSTPTLKSPFDGMNLSAWSRPEDGLNQTTQLLEEDDWEKNVDGLTGLFRLTLNHPETVLANYTQLMQLLLKQVKNLRSQVARAAVYTLGDMFLHLKRNMESDVEKIVMPLLMKTADTNKFLREDCNLALDKMVEGISYARSMSILTSEVLQHKNPVIRTTVSRLLALITDRIGANRALAGSKDITEKLLPAVAKMAQDGSLEARLYAKMTFRTLMEHPDFDRILKKHLTTNTLRGLEKVLYQVRNS